MTEPLICVSASGFEVLNSCILSSANTSSLSTHMLSESGYPSHLTKYCSHCLLLNRWESRIFSTEYSSSPSINSGAGQVKLGPCIIVSLYGVTCRWHVLLDVSWVGSVANSAKVTILRSDPKPLLSQSVGELTRVFRW
jgi:hypothetical protein